MKFHNGCWLFKEGYECFSPQMVYEVHQEEHALVLCAPTSRIQHKGDTLGGINLTIKITTPMPEVIRVQTFHHMGMLKKGPEFELDLPNPTEMKVIEEGDLLTVVSGGVSLVINKVNWSMEYHRDNKVLTKSGWRDLSYLKTDWKGFAYDHTQDEAYMRQQLGLSVGELVYGLGERFTAFVKNGQSVDIWNEDGGTSTEQSYKNIPFYLTSKGYGIFVNHPEKVEFEVATEQCSKVGFAVKGETLDYFLINGPTMKEVMMRYTDITGKPALPAQWTFGLWLSTSFTTNYDEKTVMSFIDGMQEREIPLSVFHFDCCWMREFHWSDFIWDERVFPDPQGMLSRIKEKGIKICLWINSYVGQDSALFQEGVEKGYFLKNPNGDTWQIDMWQPGLAIVDFTNPKAYKWFQQQLETLLDMGVDCFKTDFGERIPTDVVYADGSDPVKMHNYYTYLYNKCVYELLERKRGAGEAVLFARSATVGGQKFPVHWGGDCWSDYESMEESLRGGLSLTSSGFGFWSHDIGGFESQSTPDVYKRWAAFGLFSTHSRLHGSTSYRVPWAYDEESVEVVRFFTRLKLKMLPYLYSQAAHTAQTGIPMMRSMIMEFMNDMNCQYLDKQYMLGDQILAAPVFNEEGMAKYYLPEGVWTNFLTGEVDKGNHWREEYHDYLSMPVWVRENSLIPMGTQAESCEYSFLDQLEIRAFEVNKQATTKLYQNQHEVATISLVKEENTLTCTHNMKQSFTLRLVNLVAKEVNGKVITVSGKDTLIEVNATSVSILL